MEVSISGNLLPNTTSLIGYNAIQYFPSNPFVTQPDVVLEGAQPVKYNTHVDYADLTNIENPGAAVNVENGSLAKAEADAAAPAYREGSYAGQTFEPTVIASNAGAQYYHPLTNAAVTTAGSTAESSLLQAPVVLTQASETAGNSVNTSA